MVKNKDKWSSLSMSEKDALFKIYVSNGITSLSDIKKDYNSFAPGGPIEVDEYGYPADITPAIVTQDSEFNKFLMTLPDNQRLTPEEDYHTYLSWKLNGKPKTFQEAVDNDLMYSWDDSDNSYHGYSVAYDESTDTYYGLKPLHHPTASLDYDTWYQKGIHTLPGGKQVPLEGENRKEWEDFRKNYNLVFEGNDYKYVPRTSYNSFGDGGNTREMTPLEAAALNKTLNNSQYMLAVGDSPDDPAYLSTDVLEPAVVKAFNSEEDYNRYQGEKFGEYVSNEISEAGTKLAPVLVGAAAAPWAISGGIAAYSNPLIKTGLDIIGSIDGVRNAASKNGVRKTIRLAKAGDTIGAIKSGVGDVFDIAGGIGLAGDIYRYGKKASKSALLKNSGKIRDFAKGLSKNFKYALRSKQPIRFIWNNGNIIQNDFPKELLSEDAWYRIVGNGMRNKHFSDVYGAIADARSSGVVRTTRSKSIFKSPMFKKGIPFWDIQDNKALIVSNPDSDLDWVSVDYIGELNPTIPLEKNNFVGTPLYKGEPNKAPSSMFTYWRKYPFIGWRNMPLDYEEGGFLNTFEEGGDTGGNGENNSNPQLGPTKTEQYSMSEIPTEFELGVINSPFWTYNPEPTPIEPEIPYAHNYMSEDDVYKELDSIMSSTRDPKELPGKLDTFLRSQIVGNPNIKYYRDGLITDINHYIKYPYSSTIIHRNNQDRDRLHRATVDGYIPLAEQSRVVLTNAGKSTGIELSTNMLDTLAYKGGIAGAELNRLLGVPAQETGFGQFPGTTYIKPEDITALDEEHDFYGVSRSNFINNYGVNPTELMNNHYYYTNSADQATIGAIARKYGVGHDASGGQIDAYINYNEITPEVEQAFKDAYWYSTRQRDKEDIFVDPIVQAYELDATGDYNSKMKGHNELVEQRGIELWKSPEIQKWWEETGKAWYEKGLQERKSKLNRKNNSK